MKPFLLKVLLVIIPVFLLLFTIEFKARRNDNFHSAKQKTYILENSDSIEGVIFGSSMMWRALLPKYLDYNVATLARSGSGTNVDLYLYDYVNKLVAPKFYVFDLSQGYLNIVKDNEYMSRIKLKYYFPLDTNFDRELKDNFLIRVPLSKYLWKSDTLRNEKSDKWGSPVTSAKAKEGWLSDKNYKNVVLKRHNKLLTKNVDNKHMISLKKMIDDCRKNDIKLIFLSPPKYCYYNDNLNNELYLQREFFLKEFVDDKMVFFFNFEKFEENNSKFFIDLNHMSIDGAKIFSREFNKKLKTIL